MLKKTKKINLIKFNMDKSIDEIMVPIEKSIFSYGNEGWEANPKSFTEIKKEGTF